jgi:hypothetical protein
MDAHRTSNINISLGALITSNFVYCRWALFVGMYTVTWPITTAARSKARTVFALSNAGIVGSNPTQGMGVCSVFAYCVCVVLCVWRSLATGWSPVQGVLSLCIGSKNWKSGQGPTKGCRAIIIQFNSMQFNSCLFTCKLNSREANYKVSTST